jgi:hypothetical protein
MPLGSSREQRAGRVIMVNRDGSGELAGNERVSKRLVTEAKPNLFTKPVHWH